jgi:hypothetical protein
MKYLTCEAQGCAAWPVNACSAGGKDLLKDAAAGRAGLSLIWSHGPTGGYPPAKVHQTASGRASRSGFFAASHPPVLCRDGRVVVDVERYGSR